MTDLEETSERHITWSRGAHLQPLRSFHFFVGGVDELPVGGDQLLQTFLLAAAELLILPPLEVLLVAQATVGQLTGGQTSDDLKDPEGATERDGC